MTSPSGLVCLPASGVAALLLSGEATLRGGPYRYTVTVSSAEQQAIRDAARRVVMAWPNVRRKVARCNGDVYNALLREMEQAGLIVWERRRGVAPRPRRGATSDHAALWLSRLLTGRHTYVGPVG